MFTDSQRLDLPTRASFINRDPVCAAFNSHTSSCICKVRVKLEASPCPRLLHRGDCKKLISHRFTPDEIPTLHSMGEGKKKKYAM